jgi:PAS domain-containing protein
MSWGKLSIGMERIRDIEDLKRAEEVLRESEKSVRLIVDGIAGLVAIMNPEGEVEFVNNQALKYFGKTLEELKGWATSDAVAISKLTSPKDYHIVMYY